MAGSSLLINLFGSNRNEQRALAICQMNWALERDLHPLKSLVVGVGFGMGWDSIRAKAKFRVGSIESDALHVGTRSAYIPINCTAPNIARDSAILGLEYIRNEKKDYLSCSSKNKSRNAEPWACMHRTGHRSS